MTSILFAGDPHGNFEPINSAAAGKPDAIILLGDYDLELPLHEAVKPTIDAGVPIWWIHGNHDSDRERWHDNLFNSGLREFSLHGRVVEIAGIRIAGLGGIFREEIWHPKLLHGQPVFRSPEELAALTSVTGAPGAVREGIPIRHRTSIFWSDYERLWDQSADILVLHDAPESHRHGFPELGDLAKAMGVRLIVHGHHHEAYTGRTAGNIEVMGVNRETVVGLPGGC